MLKTQLHNFDLYEKAEYQHAKFTQKLAGMFWNGTLSVGKVLEIAQFAKQNFRSVR